MNTRRRFLVVECAGLGLAATALVALGAVWHADRTRAWESPRWDHPGLVTLRAAETGPIGTERTPAVETWAVAVNPACALCRGSLARGLAMNRTSRMPVQLAVLVVDTPRRPSSAALASLGGGELRWDSAGVWRGRWGHRVYGELLCFDRAGSCVRTLPPLADSIAERRAMRVGEALRERGDS